jgi:hypothetical protein
MQTLPLAASMHMTASSALNLQQLLGFFLRDDGIGRYSVERIGSIAIVITLEINHAKMDKYEA